MARNLKCKDNSVKESHCPRQAVSLGQLSNHSRVATDRQTATWSVRALGRGARPENKRHSPIRLGSWNLGSLCGRGVEVCEELRKRKVDVCGIQEVRWKNKGARFLGVIGRRYKLWWSGNSSGNGGVGILVKEELCEKVVEVRRKNDRVMAMVLAFGEKVIRVISVYGTQAGRSLEEKHQFYDDLAGEYEMQGCNEMVFGLGDFNGHVNREVEGYDGIHGGNGMEKEMQKEGCCWSFVMKGIYAWQTHGLRRMINEK